MIVVNLFGGPGCGKSTTAARLFSDLKSLGFTCEYVTEFAKDLTWEENYTALGCQEYVFGNQVYKLEKLNGKVDIVVTDSPLPLSIIYNKESSEHFQNFVFEVFNKYDNINIFIERSGRYETAGRKETLEQAMEIDKEIFNLLLTSDTQTKCFQIDNAVFGQELLLYIIQQINKMKGTFENESC